MFFHERVIEYNSSKNRGHSIHLLFFSFLPSILLPFKWLHKKKETTSTKEDIKNERTKSFLQCHHHHHNRLWFSFESTTSKKEHTKGKVATTVYSMAICIEIYESNSSSTEVSDRKVQRIIETFVCRVILKTETSCIILNRKSYNNLREIKEF